MAQALFHAGENRFVIAGLDVDDAVGNEPRLGECWGEEVGPGQAPEHFAAASGCDTGAEQSGRGAVEGTVAAAGDLMQSTPCQTAPR